MQFEHVLREVTRLISAQRWCALGTLDANNNPSVTYVPFAAVDGTVGIVVSLLSAHTANLRAHRAVSILLVDETGERHDAYARTRLTLGLVATPHASGSNQAEAIWAALEKRQGETVATLRQLPDFQAVTLEPANGRLVLGFASAHDLDAATIARALRHSG